MSVPICAIDPGMGGGICFYKDGLKVTAVNMPQTAKDLWDYFSYLKDTYGTYLVCIERVNTWKGDSETPGKSFGIEKMLANYNQIVGIVEANDLPIAEISAVAWQRGLGLYFPGTEKQVRKNKYKRYALTKYPSIKVTLKNADALCILSFARIKVLTDPKWITKRIRNKDTLKLFR